MTFARFPRIAGPALGLALALTTTLHLHAAAFPGAMGYGANATGGSKEILVTNLNDAGEGSLRAAAAVKGSRVVFKIAGTIVLKSELSVAGNLTLDGTTAPNPGITITGFPVSLSGQSNLIIRNLRFREGIGGPPRKCSLQGTNCSNLIVDHCSIEQGRWDCLEFTGHSHDITVQWCLIGEGVAPQNFGTLLNGEDRITLQHNLFVDNKSRNPKLKANAQYINNVVYNWGGGGGLVGGHSKAKWNSDVINNFFMAGPSSNANWLAMCTASDTWYVAGNVGDFDKDGFVNARTIPSADFAAKGVTIRPAIMHRPVAPVTIDPASHCLELAISGAMGCQPNDETDQRLCGYVKSAGKLGQMGTP
jgi:pectate lyase